MSVDDKPRMVLATPADLLCALPYLLGFHPADSLVLAGFAGRPPDGRLRLTARWDLPLAAGAPPRLAPLLAREDVTRVALVGYGPGTLVTPAMDAVIPLLRDAGVAVLEALRTDGSRYWSYLCRNVRCCPPEGVPYDVASSPVAAQATLHGMVALPDRDALERTLTPVGGPVRRAMRRATARVAAEFRRRLLAAERPDDFAAEFVTGGLARVRDAVRVYRSGGRLGDEEAARLGLDLAVIRVRDEAWTLIDDDTIGAHLELWRDLATRLEPPFVPPAAALLGVAAWRNGDCTLAGIAVGRALALDPDYTMARLLSEGLRHLVPPEILRSGPTAEELDQQMGRPTVAWLIPLCGLLDDAGLSRSAPGRAEAS
ncbi:MAG: DUF4192 domain-containing protein [Actinomycetes bacterium]|jgi:hypothetical protein